ncbi:MAG: HAD family phosphatase [Oscillospiraceae bacterium]|nr:HAD family phosphatase [Oscillospiraceae bacterium]
MRALTNIKAAVFDLDGTILDSSGIWDGLGERFLASRNITPEPGLSARLNCMALPESCEYLKSEYHLPETPEQIQTEICGIIAYFYRNECGLNPGAAELLTELSRRGIALSIATAGDKELSRAALERLGLLDMFSGVATCNECGGKNHPEIFLKAAELAGGTPQNTAVFEDSLHAVITAKNAGFLTAAVMDMSEPQQAALRNTADYYREDLSGYLELFRG